MGLHRTHRRRMDRDDARAMQAQNRVFKDDERGRRDTRMLAMLRSVSPPYLPAVMSWLSRRLDKPARRITPQDIKALLT